MKLPDQSKPIIRNSTNIILNNRNIKPSMFYACQECDNLPEPAKTACKIMCIRF
ncbi:MAG: hypothetical protein ACREV6_09830 [Clostridium sp.]|uniref:hypothetical protein n=1 Tax=Clostridium sp. TaxID=1506 RepID=UPI003D6D54CA